MLSIALRFNALLKDHFRWKGEGIIIYLVMLFIIGLPTVIMEILVGN